MGRLARKITYATVALATIGVAVAASAYRQWDAEQHAAFLKAATDYPRPIENAEQAIAFGKDYAARDLEFVKGAGYASATDLASAIARHPDCCGATIEAFLADKPAIWFITVSTYARNEHTVLFLHSTACRRMMKAHW